MPPIIYIFNTLCTRGKLTHNPIGLIGTFTQYINGMVYVCSGKKLTH